MILRLGIAGLLLCFRVGVASADVAVPNQELCTIDTQQRDGSSCEQCSWVGYEQGARKVACGPLVARGLTERCGYGATHATAIYCDREANWIEVGGGSSANPTAPNPSTAGGCNCTVGSTGDAGSTGRSIAWLALLAASIRPPRT